MKRLVLCFSFIFLYAGSIGVICSQDKFCVAVGQTCYDEAFSIVQSDDGGVVAAGLSSVSVTGLIKDPYIIKLNSNGVLQWTNLIGKGGAYPLNSSAASIAKSSDGGYIVAGSICCYERGAYLMKLDSNGSMVWNKIIGGPGYLEAASIIQTSEGGYAFCGSYTLNPNLEVKDVYVAKINSIGSVQWSRIIGGTGNDNGASIVQSSDGGYVIAGGTKSFGVGVTDVYVVKLDGTGALQWTRTVGGSGTDGASSIVQTFDEGYVIVGNTETPTANQDILVIKLDKLGGLDWARTTGGGSYDVSRSVIQASDGDYVLCGTTVSFGNGYNAYVVKMNTSGNLVWNSSLGNVGNEEAFSIIQTSNSGFAVAGFTSSFGAGNEDFFIATMDNAGVGCCNVASGGTLNVPTMVLGVGGTVVSGPDTESCNGYNFSAGKLTVNCGPPIAFSAMLNVVNPSCSGSCNGVAEVNGYGGLPPYTYLWSTGETTKVISSLCAGNYSVTVSDASPASTVKIFSVSQPNPLVVNISPGATTICAGSCDTLESIINGGNCGYIFSWFPGNLSGSEVTVCPTTATAYTMIATDSRGCKDTAYSYIATIASPSISILASNTTICIGQSSSLSATPCANYLWSTNATTSSISVSPTVTSTYSVFCTDASNGCAGKGTATVIVQPCTGIFVDENSFDILISPNPANGRFQIQMATNEVIKGEINVLNVLGRRVYSSTQILENSEIDISSLPRGVYFLQITTEKGIVSKKVVIQK